MIIHHGSKSIVKRPKIIRAKFSKDFGTGFYCTDIKQQAVRWATRYPGRAVLNIYEYNENYSLNKLEFTHMTEDWLDCIVSCRAGMEHNFDIVIGPMADDQIYNYINEFVEGRITKAAFWELAKFAYPTHQIAFCSEKSLKSIKFVEEVTLNG